MTLQEIIDLVDEVTYKPNWTLYVAGSERDLLAGNAYLQVKVFDGHDSITHDLVDWSGAKHRLSQWMCRQEIIGLCFKAIKDAEEHEMREFFRYKGRSIYNPHLDPDALVITASKKENFNCREQAMNVR